jgi:membrane fusion protein (multidrug efflux system)
LAGAGSPPATVTTMAVAEDEWQPQLTASGSMRAYRGVELSTEVNGIVKEVLVKSGVDVKEGTLLMSLVQDADIAQLHALQAQADLAKVINDRDRQQLAIEAISKNAFDSSSADLKAKTAQVEQQTALVAKKNLKAPFSGRVGIVSINPGQFINNGDKIMTLQTIDPIFVDFTLPQTVAAQIKKDLIVNLNTDAFGNQNFKGKVTAISPKVDANTRNIQVEALISNPDKKLLPGMFANLKVDMGQKAKYITVPQTSVSYNPYGSIIYLAVEGTGKDGKSSVEAKQVFVSTGPTRGDQVAILKGLSVGDTIVTSGQLKLKNGTPLIVNNSVSPANNPNPTPQE